MSQPNRAHDAFDQAIADTAQELDEIAQQTLESDEVKQALEDEDRDDAW